MSKQMVTLTLFISRIARCFIAKQMCMHLIFLLSLYFTNNSALNVTIGGRHSCALELEYNNAKCWGFNGYGELGYGDTNHRGGEPNEMGANLQRIDLGSNFIPIQIKCWGLNRRGELGHG
eukprot:831454_1